MPKPTSRQLTYLKTLANQRGVSFAYPHTSAEASQEINRLKRLRPESRPDRRRERKDIADAIQAGPINAAARLRADEIDGHGSSAHWAHNHDPSPESNPGHTPRTTRPVVGERTRLGSYQLAGERRVIIGQRVDGARISDCPDGTAGRAFLIERDLETKAELDAVVADYLKRATELQAVPMSVMPVESGLLH
jgi:hypothetical protein